jgi:hypothetical protein
MCLALTVTFTVDLLLACLPKSNAPAAKIQRCRGRVSHVQKPIQKAKVRMQKFMPRQTRMQSLCFDIPLLTSAFPLSLPK